MKIKKISSFLDLINFFKKPFLKKIENTNENNFNVKDTVDEQVKRLKNEEIERGAITENLNKLFDVQEYNQINSFFEDFSNHIDKMVNHKFYKNVLYKIPNLFKDELDEKKIEFIKMLNNPILNQKVSDVFNRLYTREVLDEWSYYDVSDNDSLHNSVINPLSKLSSYNSSYQKMIQKMFNIDIKNKKLEYLGLSKLSSNEKLLLNISFLNIKANLEAETKLEKSLSAINIYKVLLTDALVLIAFLKEFPEYQGNSVLTNRHDVKLYTSNIGVELKVLLNNKNKDRYEDVAENFIDFFIKELTTKPYVIAKHDEMVNELRMKYSDNFMTELKNSELPQDYKDRISSQYNLIEDWKKNVNASDMELVNFINKSSESLKNVVKLHEQLSVFSSSNIEPLKLINEILDSIDNGIAQNSEQKIDFFKKSSNVQKKLSA